MRDHGTSRQVTIILLGRFLSDFGRGFSVPYLPIYFEEEVGLTVSVIGLGFLLNSLLAGIAVFAGSYVTDRFGRKSSLCASMVASAAISLLYPLARTPGAYLLVSMLAGAALALYWPASLAMLTDLSRPSERGTVFGWLRVAANAGVGLGSIGGALTLSLLEGVGPSRLTRYHALFWIDGATYFLFFLIILFLVRETLPAEAARAYGGFRRGWGQAFRHGTLLALAAINVGFVLTYSLFLVGFSTFFKQYARMSFFQMSLALGLNTAMVVFLQMPLWAMVDSWRRTRSLALAALLIAAGLVLLNLCSLAGGVSSALAVVLVAFLVLSTGEILHGPAVSSLFSNIAPAHLRGTYMGVQSLCWSVGMGIGPVVTGPLLDARRPYVLFNGLVGVLLLALIATVLLEPRLPPEANRPEGEPEQEEVQGTAAAGASLPGP